MHFRIGVIHLVIKTSLHKTNISCYFDHFQGWLILTAEANTPLKLISRKGKEFFSFLSCSQTAIHAKTLLTVLSIYLTQQVLLLNFLLFSKRLYVLGKGKTLLGLIQYHVESSGKKPQESVLSWSINLKKAGNMKQHLQTPQKIGGTDL